MAPKTSVKELKEQLKEAKDRIVELERENLTAFAIGDAVVDGIIVVNKEGIVVKVNGGYTEITEIKPEEVIGKSINKIKEQNLFTHFVSDQVLKNKRKTSAMATIIKNNKRVLMVGSPIFDKSGEFIKIVTVIRDITSLVNLKDKLEKVEEKKRYIQNKLDNLINADEWNNFRGSSAKILRIKELIKYAAPTDATVFIVGETGVGKEVVAREVYEKSERSEGAYVKINCAAIPENLLESELFGYAKGAFTGADKKAKKGLFEIADGGTILLDEITEMPLSLQPKLLRVLQEREFTPLGGVKSIKVNVRIIASCNKAPEELVKKGLFRADLYYRLNVFPIQMPSLRERREDVTDIAITFLERFNKSYEKDKAFGSTAIFALSNYNWPGNVRELQNAIERMVIVSTNKILTNIDVNLAIGVTDEESYREKKSYLGTKSLKEAVKETERELIVEALEKGGSTYAAAELLKTTQPTIVRKAKALRIDTSKQK